jgi:hypothetical protein
LFTRIPIRKTTKSPSSCAVIRAGIIWDIWFETPRLTPIQRVKYSPVCGCLRNRGMSVIVDRSESLWGSWNRRNDPSRSLPVRASAAVIEGGPATPAISSAAESTMGRKAENLYEGVRF